MPDTPEPSICGFRYDLWDGPYVMRHECIASPGHTSGQFAHDHGPWQYLPTTAAPAVPEGDDHA